MPSQSSTIYLAPTNTPTGAAFAYAMDNQYVTSADFIQHPAVSDGLGLTASDNLYTSGYLDKLLLRASVYVNRYCNRHFDIQTIDETISRLTLGTKNVEHFITIILNEAPIRSVNRIDFQVLNNFIPINLTYLVNSYPNEGYFEITPTLFAATGATSPIPKDTKIGTFWINYSFGYTVLPADVIEAVILKTISLIAQQRNILGVTNFKTNQLSLTWDKDKNLLEEQIKTLLNPYRRVTLRVA